MISMAPVLDGGVRRYIIVFSSNAPDPANFNGADSPALDADANSEIWIYKLPPVADVDLTLGTDIPTPLDFPVGESAFERITDTPASRAPTAGATNVSPFFADDNREATISDDGRIIAFISTRNFAGHHWQCGFQSGIVSLHESCQWHWRHFKTGDRYEGCHSRPRFHFSNEPIFIGRWIQSVFHVECEQLRHEHRRLDQFQQQRQQCRDLLRRRGGQRHNISSGYADAKQHHDCSSTESGPPIESRWKAHRLRIESD